MKTIAICDLETNGLFQPDKIWLAGFLDVETNTTTIIERPDLNKEDFINQINQYDVVVGHNFISYDLPVLQSFNLEGKHTWRTIKDTLILSHLLNYKKQGGHSLANWGEQFNFPKKEWTDFSKYDPAMVDYLRRDLELNLKLWQYFQRLVNHPSYHSSIELEHSSAYFCADMKRNGFAFNKDKANKLRNTIDSRISVLDQFILKEFSGTYKFHRVINPKSTKFGTINLSDFRWCNDISPYSIGSPFSLIDYEPFNPNSTKQIIDRISQYGWEPTEKTKSHILAEKENSPKLPHFRKYGWKLNDTNLSTVSKDAPESTQKLVERLLLSKRRSTLTEWLEAYHEPSGRIHGTINSIGTWTHRMSHTNPNLGNIPARDKPYSLEMRSLWQAGPQRRLLGVDAESIQLRVFAHYLNDPKFTESLVIGNSKDGTDPHTLNKHVLGRVCKDRDVAKTFIYAWLLGAGLKKQAQILNCTLDEAEEANYNFLMRYPGLKKLKEEQIPEDARRGYFIGIDDRRIICTSSHLMLAGYLQNAEVIVMKRGNLIWREELDKQQIPYWQINLVHDEYQTETLNDDLAKQIQLIQANAIRKAGEYYNLNCPMAGGLLNKHKELAIGNNWTETH